jgi:hypothetical protein
LNNYSAGFILTMGEEEKKKKNRRQQSAAELDYSALSETAD